MTIQPDIAAAAAAVEVATVKNETPVSSSLPLDQKEEEKKQEGEEGEQLDSTSSATTTTTTTTTEDDGGNQGGTSSNNSNSKQGRLIKLRQQKSEKEAAVNSILQQRQSQDESDNGDCDDNDNDNNNNDVQNRSSNNVDGWSFSKETEKLINTENNNFSEEEEENSSHDDHLDVYCDSGDPLTVVQEADEEEESQESSAEPNMNTIQNIAAMTTITTPSKTNDSENDKNSLVDEKKRVARDSLDDVLMDSPGTSGIVQSMNDLNDTSKTHDNESDKNAAVNKKRRTVRDSLDDVLTDSPGTSEIASSSRNHQQQQSINDLNDTAGNDEDGDNDANNIHNSLDVEDGKNDEIFTELVIQNQDSSEIVKRASSGGNDQDASPPLENEIIELSERIPLAVENQGVIHVNNNSSQEESSPRYISVSTQQEHVVMNTQHLTPPAAYTKNGHTVIAHQPQIPLIQSQEQIAMPHPMYVFPPVQQQPTRRSMKLRLEEERRSEYSSTEDSQGKRTSILSRMSLRRPKAHSFGNDDEIVEKIFSDTTTTIVDRGTISVSWYTGTTTIELQQHVKTSVERKLGLGSKKLLRNFRVLDVTVQPNEEIVLSSYIPHGSEFLVRFRIKDNTVSWKYPKRAPDSPSAAPSPPGEFDQLSEQIKMIVDLESKSMAKPKPMMPDITNGSKVVTPKGRSSPQTDSIVAHQDLLSQRLEKLSETLLRLHEDGPYAKDQIYQVEKRQVVFTIANYLILFLSLIAISAEIHERAPRWIAWIDANVASVRNCAEDRDALFECVSTGDFSGLIASIVLWGTTSVSTKRFFLFGFDSPTKLWTVVYEAGVSAFCWGVSYMLIRRGLNPDTRPQFLTKYWKDAVYGSLAGFNAAFMKAVLKNLIPQEQMLDVLDQRQLRIVGFLEKIFSPATWE